MIFKAKNPQVNLKKQLKERGEPMAVAGRPKGSSSKIKKIKVTDKLGEPTRCLCCNKTYPRQKGFFSPSHSQIFASNNGFLPVCQDCVNALLKKYIEELDDDEEAFKRICLHFDLYYSPGIYTSAKSGKGISFLMGNYFSRSNGTQFYRPGSKEYRTYDDTVMEESAKVAEDAAEEEALKNGNPDAINTVEDLDEAKENKEIKVPQKSIKFWGFGFEPSEYKWLDDEYSSWVIRANNGETPSKSLEVTLKEMCKTSVDIKRARKANAKANEISTLQSTYIKYMEKAGLSPDQEDNTNIAEKNALGVLIDVWESTEPVPDYPDENKLQQYVDVWFKGHLARASNLKNETKENYDAEIEKFKIKIMGNEDDESEISEVIQENGNTDEK